MRTNVEKFNYYSEILDQRAAPFLEKFKKDLPEKVWAVTPQKVKEILIVKIRYRWGKPIFYERPTREQVNEIKELAESHHDFTRENVLVHLESRDDGWKSSWAESYDRFISSNYISRKEEVADELLKIEQRLDEEKRLKEKGYINCRHCGKLTAPDSIVRKPIISRQYANFRKEFDFCSGECAGHHQMAHEG